MANKPGNVVYVERQQGNGCLLNALIFVLFGWIGLAAVALWSLTKWVWRWCVVFPAVWTWRIGLQYPLVWTWKGCVALVTWSVATVQGMRQQRKSDSTQER